MKKRVALMIMVIAGLVSIIASAAYIFGQIPLWVTEAILVIAFPLFVLFLGLYWRAGEKDPDMPFLGY
jgi:hypothetical protein